MPTKSNTQHIFTVHQILRKIHKTCTTYMQNISPILDLKECVALDLMNALYLLLCHREVGPKLCILPEMQSHRSATHEPETGHYQKNLMWRKLPQ